MFVNAFCFVLCVVCFCFLLFCFFSCFQKCSTMVSQYSIEQLGICSCSGRSEEDGGSMYRVRSEELFLVSSEVF